MEKDGIDYFPLETGFLRDKKVLLIKSKYGAKGVVIVIYLLSKIYEEHGYYMKWDEDDSYLSADAIGCGVTPELTTQVVDECIRRSMFDEQLLNEFGILTSHGIQKRFLRAAKKRENIEFIKEYFLLDMSNVKDVPKSISIKCTFSSIKVSGNSEKVSGNSKKVSGKAQSKVKESRVKESKVEESKINTFCAEPENQAPAPPVITLPLNDKTEFPIYDKHVAEWIELYPAVDVMQELRNMRGWLNSNPTKRKTARGIMRFITGWLSREQDSPKRRLANTYRSQEEKQQESRDMLYEWAKEMKGGY